MALLGQEFFARDTSDVARELLGATLRVRDAKGIWSAGRIVETEAYGGRDDPASHAGRGPTPRSGVMFGPAGVAYVYLIYGVYHCLNFVTEKEGVAGAVLIRALEPLDGLSLMARRRGLDPEQHRSADLCSGPGKLCQALGVDLAWNGVPVTVAETTVARRMQVEAAPTPVVWQAGPRIGITRAKDRPLRFIDPHSNGLSR